jgi:hypothetical protein
MLKQSKRATEIPVFVFPVRITNKEIMRLNRLALIVLSFSNFSISACQMASTTGIKNEKTRTNHLTFRLLLPKSVNENVSGEFLHGNIGISYIGIQILFFPLYR